MKRKGPGLFVKVLIAITLGVAIGFVFEYAFNNTPDDGFFYGLSNALVRIFKTFNVIFAQLLKFIVPLLVLGLVTPAIANVGRGAGKMLLAVMLIAYVSTICAGFFSHLCASNLFPFYLEPGELSTDAVSVRVIKPFIDLKIPPLCDILTALCLSFMIGIGLIFIDAPALHKGFNEFGLVVKLTIEKAIIPLLPYYIFTMMCEMAAKGVASVVLGTGFKVILTGLLLSIVFLIVQYVLAGVVARKNPFKCLWNMLPAYLTGFSICSSSAVIPVTSECARKNGVSDDIVDFTIPLCSTVHMCGSTIKLAVTSIAVAYVTGTALPFAVYANFVLLQGVAAVAAPGVMGGVLMASVGLLESVMGFSPEQTALVMAIYLALDGYGPACNVTGDGAIALVIDKIFGKTERFGKTCE